MKKSSKAILIIAIMVVILAVIVPLICIFDNEIVKSFGIAGIVAGMFTINFIAKAEE